MSAESEIINAEFLFILMHSIHFQKLIGEGVQDWRIAQSSKYPCAGPGYKNKFSLS
jgi:hypothetical protein